MIAVFRRFTGERMKLIGKDFLTFESVAIELLTDKIALEEFIIFPYKSEIELRDKERIYNLRLI